MSTLPPPEEAAGQRSTEHTAAVPPPYPPPPPPVAPAQNATVDTRNERLDDGINRCPRCGATDIQLRPSAGMLVCLFCRHEWAEARLDESVTTSGDLASLRGTIIGSGAADISAVLDAVLDPRSAVVPEPLRGLADPTRVGMYGHSYGAATAGRVAQNDPRVLATMPIAAPVENPFFPNTHVADIHVPMLSVLAEEDNSIGAIGDIRVRSASGAPIPLSELAAIEMREGPARISREQAKRRIYIGFNVVGRDIGGVVDEGRKRLAEQIRLPQGYTVAWGGAFENMERANARLLLVVPITLGLVFFLLFWAFHSLRYAGLIILNLPFALIGGVVSLWLSDQYLSVPASIGFIELFGLAVGNGIVLVSYINQLRNEGQQTEVAIITGCVLRLRPVVMTMMTTLLGLLPLVLAQGIGAEVQRPLATVVIGGLFTSTALTLLVLPALATWLLRRSKISKPEERF